MLSERDIVSARAAPDRDAAQGVGAARLDQAGRPGRAQGFSEADMARAALIRDLEDELGFAEEDVPVLLNLIDQIHGLRSRADGLLDALEDLPRRGPRHGEAAHHQKPKQADGALAAVAGRSCSRSSWSLTFASVHFGLGRLPGDIVIDRGGFVLYAPITTAIIVSLLLSLVLWLFRRIRCAVRP